MIASAVFGGTKSERRQMGDGFPLAYTSLFSSGKSVSIIPCLHIHYHGLFLLLFHFSPLFTIFPNWAVLVEAGLFFTCHGVTLSISLFLYP
ncbi:hypothetical protein HOY80DRAFT_195395 [Tuber brumale]|nr:hypothetical protein HOY80DRAFT_195395 [Tuber brumale]